MEHKADGIIEKHKARLVAKGFNQRQGIDFDETFNPMVKLTSISLELPIGISYGWHIHQLEFNNVFLHGLINKDVYMFQMKGFIDPTRPDFVCKLNRALYGLCQAPRAYFHRFTSYLSHIGFQGCKFDYSMFAYSGNGGMAVLLLYVDDIVLIVSSYSLLCHFIQLLKDDFSMSNMGSLHYFLSVKVKKNSNGLILC